ncbi:MAG: HD domain-containing phosphohydrolase [Acidobacteriota bacterium]
MDEAAIDWRLTSSPKQNTVLIVDDLEGNARLLEAILRSDGHRCIAASNGQEALALVDRDHPDVILMDVMMPHLDGLQACRQLKSDPATRLIPVVLLTALQDSDSRIRGLEAGADDFISKPFNGAELRARVRSLMRIKCYTDDLDSAEAVIMSLALTIEARDRTTEGHCQRLAAYAAAMGEAMGLAADEVGALHRGGYLHDVGKVGIPDAVLLKPGKLTPVEFEVLKQHTVIGDRLCGELRSLHRVRPIVRSHHERLDGSGYPDGLRGDEVPLLAQIISVVDVFDALTTERPYKAAWSRGQAIEELHNDVRRGWRARGITDVFVSLVANDRLPVLAGTEARALTRGSAA